MHFFQLLKKNHYHDFLKTFILKKMVRSKTIFFSHFEKGPILLKNLQKPSKPLKKGGVPGI